MKTIAQLKEELEAVTSIFDPLLVECRKDKRKSVQVFVKSCEKRILKHNTQISNYEEMLFFERRLHVNNVKLIAGVDEVGRGCIAGPVVAAAVILPDDLNLYGINDSKKLSDKMRRSFFDNIKNKAISYAISVVSPKIIDDINIYEASKWGMDKAVAALNVQPEHILVDAMKLQSSLPQTSIIKGDERSVSIAAASILAKVTRDDIMIDYHKQYPVYNFKKNKGYGTKEHIVSLQENGVSLIHRKSFAPCSNYF